MARNVNDMNETEADEATQGGHIMERDAFLDVLSTVSAKKGKISKMTGDVSALLNKAENDHNMDKKAFSIVQWARRQEPTRVNAFLRHFDAYRGYADLDVMAGSDLFEGATAAPEKAASELKSGGGKRGRPPKNAPKVAKKAKASASTGKPRGRPPKPKNDLEPVSAAEAAATAWGLNDQSETAGAA